MNKIFMSYAILFFFASTLSITVLCSNPNTTSYSDKLFSPGEKVTKKQATAGRFFILYPGDTAVFSGTRRCTIFVNGTVENTESDSVSFKTITHAPSRIMIGDSEYTVYAQTQKFGSTAADSPAHYVTRYFERTKKYVRQWAYRDEKGLHIPLQTTVIPETLITGNRWETSPMLPFDFVEKSSANTWSGYGFTRKALATFTHKRNFYGQSVLVEYYYSLNLETTREGKAQYTTGTIIIQSYYAKDIGLLKRVIKARIQRNLHNGKNRSHVYTISMGRSGDYVEKLPEL